MQVIHIVSANKRICSRNSSPDMLSEKSLVKYLAKFTGKRLYRRLFENKFIGSRPATILKKRLLHMGFFVNFLNLFRTAF